jgi:hypothetical protein
MLLNAKFYESTVNFYMISSIAVVITTKQNEKLTTFFLKSKNGSAISGLDRIFSVFGPEAIDLDFEVSVWAKYWRPSNPK